MYRISDYPEIQNNFYLGSRNTGASRKLVGDVNIITVFVSKTPDDWCEAIKNEYRKSIHIAADFLTSQARRYGTYLNIRCLYLETTVPYDADPHKGFYLLRNFFHSPDMQRLQEYYEKHMGVDEVPIILAFNERGRSFAFEKNDYQFYDVQETSVLFFDNDANAKEEAMSIAHEILHQFGALDYYYPEAVTEIAKKYLFDSIMGIGKKVVDDLTAYLVGWKDTISAGSYWFLHDTMWMTDERYTQAIRNEWKK